MKEKIVSTLLLFAMILVIYYMAAFVSWSFQIGEWHPIVRFCYMVLVITAGYRTYISKG